MWLGVVSCKVYGAWYFSEAALLKWALSSLSQPDTVVIWLKNCWKLHLILNKQQLPLVTSSYWAIDVYGNKQKSSPYADFCKFKEFYKKGANLKKILILRPKLGVQTQFLMKNCMLLKQLAWQLGGCIPPPTHTPPPVPPPPHAGLQTTTTDTSGSQWFPQLLKDEIFNDDNEQFDQRITYTACSPQTLVDPSYQSNSKTTRVATLIMSLWTLTWTLAKPCLLTGLVRVYSPESYIF